MLVGANLTSTLLQLKKSNNSSATGFPNIKQQLNRDRQIIKTLGIIDKKNGLVVEEILEEDEESDHEVKNPIQERLEKIKQPRNSTSSSEDDGDEEDSEIKDNELELER